MPLLSTAMPEMWVPQPPGGLGQPGDGTVYSVTPLLVPLDAWLMTRCLCWKLFGCCSRRKKFFDLAHTQFGKPDMPELVNRQVKRAGLRRRHRPLVPLATGIVFADRVGDGFGKPQIARAIELEKKGAGKDGRKTCRRLKQFSGRRAAVEAACPIFEEAVGDRM